MYNIPDHPVIANLMRTGYPDGKEPPEIRCPVCGREGEEFYVAMDGTVVGCDCCVLVKQYYEVEEF